MSGSSSPLITLTTDFGLRDSYVGCMKGVILSIAPSAHIIDICHAVPPQDIRHGAYTLWSSASMFPEGTIHVVVVDPGVGSARKAVAVQSAGQIFVGPDNGVLWPTVSQDKAYRGCQLTEHQWFRHPISATFHGRDIFTPVAAHIARGVSLSQLGPELSELQRLELFDATAGKDHVQGKIILADHFGNLATNISAVQLPPSEHYQRCIVKVAAHQWAGIAQTFSDVPAGAMVAYINSFGLLELAVRNGSAADSLNLPQDTAILVQW